MRAFIARESAIGESAAMCPTVFPWYLPSLPETSTSSTPGTALAASVSAASSTAAPYGQRMNAQKIASLGYTSRPYLARPVTFATPSSRDVSSLTDDPAFCGRFVVGITEGT